MPASQHPGNDYYANLITGTIQRQSNRLFPEPLLPPVWAGPYDWATAKAMVAGAHTAFQKESQLGGSPIPGGIGPGAPGVGGAAGLASKGISNPLGGIAAIGDFFNRLTQPNTWLRVGEFAAGGLLIYLGLSAAMKGSDAQTVTQGVTKPVKKAANLVPGVKEAKIARSAEARVARERRVTEHAKKIRAADRARKAGTQ